MQVIDFTSADRIMSEGHTSKGDQPKWKLTSSQKGADSSSPFGADPDSSGTFGRFLVSSTAGNYCSWDT